MDTSRDILCGLETEYGLLVEGSGADAQVRHSMELVAGYPGPCAEGWDYAFESPRADLRGFRLDYLNVDPEDAKFDEGNDWVPVGEVRADRILPNGARLYNDHGHPEYSTPECRSLDDLARHDLAGEIAVHRAGVAYAARIGREVGLYKNNTDFHGASYGTHESYLVPRAFGFDRLFPALLPMLVARLPLVGGGKVGAEHGERVPFQISQRADFFTEKASADTLYRRPIFNTRDEPHAEPNDWIRLHVIAGDANRLPTTIKLKAGLVKLALMLLFRGEVPIWNLDDPVRTIAAISKDQDHNFRIPLEGRSWTNAPEVLESYFSAAERALDLANDPDLRWTIETSRRLLPLIATDRASVAREIDWAAKLAMLEQILASEEEALTETEMQSYDLEWANVDPEASLFDALAAMGSIDTFAPDAALLETPPADTRAALRGYAVAHLRDDLLAASWRAVTFRTPDGPRRVELPPTWKGGTLPPDLGVEGFIRTVENPS